VLFDKKITKLFPYILFQKYIYILALETASPENQHCASCIGTLSFPVSAQFLRIQVLVHESVCGVIGSKTRSMVGLQCRHEN